MASTAGRRWEMDGGKERWTCVRNLLASTAWDKEDFLPQLHLDRAAQSHSLISSSFPRISFQRDCSALQNGSDPDSLQIPAIAWLTPWLPRKPRRMSEGSGDEVERGSHHGEHVQCEGRRRLCAQSLTVPGSSSVHTEVLCM